MSKLASRLVRLEVRHRDREEQKQQSMLQPLTDQHLEEFIERIKVLEETMILESLSEEELRARQAELVEWLRQRASEDD